MIAIVAILFSSLVAWTPFTTPEATASAPHAPILINGNVNFTAANGVTRGSGTSQDPYVIEGWSIDALSSNGIQIRDTDAFFLIRYTTVTRYPLNSCCSGVSLLNVTHGRLESMGVDFDSFGILVQASRDVSVSSTSVGAYKVDGVRVTDSAGVVLRNNTVTGGDGSVGLRILNSSNVTLDGNRIEFNYNHGILLVSSFDFVVSDNHVSMTPFYDIAVVSSSRATITGNVISGAGLSSGGGGFSLLDSGDLVLSNNTVSEEASGIVVSSAWNATLADNAIEGSRAYGLNLGYLQVSAVVGNNVSGTTGAGIACWCQNVTIRSNTVEGNQVGLELTSSTGVRVHHNRILNNGVQARDTTGSNAWDDGYPSGGNYWSDYTGPDDCSGPLQDVCPAPDGLGDVPRVIDTDTQDRYPIVGSPGVPTPEIVEASLSGVGGSDLILIWRRAWDEGLPDGTLDYRITKATNLGGPYAEIASITANGSLAYVYVCPGCGHVLADTNLTFYRVRSVNDQGRVADSNSAARYARAVIQGWNLLSIPLDQTDYSTASVLQTLDYAAVRTYDAGDLNPWRGWHSAKANSPLMLDLGAALWVDVTTSGQYTLAGLVEDSPTFALLPGWNLLGYASFGNESRDVSLASLAGVGTVETFDFAVIDPYGLRTVPGSETLIFGEAYWIRIDSGGGMWIQD